MRLKVVVVLLLLKRSPVIYSVSFKYLVAKVASFCTTIATVSMLCCIDTQNGVLEHCDHWVVDEESVVMTCITSSNPDVLLCIQQEGQC